jgi:phosphoglycolate phosphatase-like HAD superfamily hydrolase
MQPVPQSPNPHPGKRLDPLLGALEVFRALRDARVPPAIATASYRPIIDASLEAVGVGPDAVVVDGKGALHGKPEPTSSWRAGRGSAPSRRTASSSSTPSGTTSRRGRAGMLSVGVLTGGYGEEELYHARAFRVYRNIADLLQNLDELGILL